MDDAAAEQFMREALRVAAAGLAQGELPIGAVVVAGDRIIAAAHTAERTQRRLLVHAEWLALDAADRLQPFPGKRREVVLVTTVEPCLMCLGAAMSFGVGTLYYALDAPTDGAVGLVAQHWRPAAVGFPAYRVPAMRGGVCQAESRALFQTYVQRQPTGPLADWARTLLTP